MTRLKIVLAVIGAAVVALLTALGQARQAGKQDAEDEANANTLERIEAGRQAVRDGRGNLPDDRVRNNDDAW